MRRVITEDDVEKFIAKAPVGTPTPTVDDYSSKLMKYIPAETVAGFVTLNGLLSAVPGVTLGFLWFVFVTLVLLTMGYAWRSTQYKPLPPAYLQIAIMTVAFVVWVFSIGGPFTYFAWYKEYYGATILILYTIFIPLIAP
jgi:hypothetical protein